MGRPWVDHVGTRALRAANTPSDGRLRRLLPYSPTRPRRCRASCRVFVGIYILLIFAYVLLSWIQLPYSGVAATVQRFLDEVCRPYLGLFRGRIPTLGPLDLSPIVAVVVLLVAAGLVNRLIGALL